MRGGLDDALDKLARRDELRRRATGESPGTPPAVTELVEAIAAVVARHPNMNVTVGVEGAGDPTLLHFAFADGVVQVNADNQIAARAAESPRHADFEIDVDEVVEEPPPAPAYRSDPPRGSHDDQDRFGPTDFGYAEPPTAERPYVAPASNGYRPDDYTTPPQGQPIYTNGATQETGTHPFAAPAPPPVPPQTPQPYASAPPPYATTPSPPPPPAYPEPPAAAAPPFTAPHAEPQPGFPEPLAQPIPLQVERPEETEMAARRLAAMLRDDPTLLDDPPQ